MRKGKIVAVTQYRDFILVFTDYGYVFRGFWNESHGMVFEILCALNMD